MNTKREDSYLVSQCQTSKKAVDEESTGDFLATTNLEYPIAQLFHYEKGRYIVYSTCNEWFDYYNALIFQSLQGKNTVCFNCLDGAPIRVTDTLFKFRILQPWWSKHDRNMKIEIYFDVDEWKSIRPGEGTDNP